MILYSLEKYIAALSFFSYDAKDKLIKIFMGIIREKRVLNNQYKFLINAKVFFVEKKIFMSRQYNNHSNLAKNWCDL